MKTLSIDIETYSDVDLGKSGVYRYAESDAFEILLFGYSVDGGEVNIVDLAMGEKIPEEILKALISEDVTKWAFNANFERVCLSKYLGYPTGEYLNPSSWCCTMVWSAYLGLPLSLQGVGSVLKLDEQKMKEGKDLIRYFCTPCQPTKTNGGRTKNLFFHTPDKWETFKAYNKSDVEVEMAIKERLKKYPVPDFVWDEYHQDQEINDRGISVDTDMVDCAISLDEQSRSEISRKIINLTALENPNSVMQMKDWLSQNGVDTNDLGKKNVAELKKEYDGGIIGEVMSLRQMLAKSSVKKYQAMKNAVCSDNRARGMFMFYGANRTGRFSGRIIQLQNLPQNHIEELAKARDTVKSCVYGDISKQYDNVPDLLSQLIRTAFIPRDGCKFIVSDFSAIEARVIAWLAGEDWRLQTFKDGKDIYCASASQMFSVPVEKHGVNGHLRQKGKIAELALGYGGSVGALKAMGALDMGLSENELKPLVIAWRSSNPNITKLWWDVDSAAMRAVKERIPSEVKGINFFCQSGMLFIKLPSGRCLSYVKPHLGINQFGSECITYEGTGTAKKWERLETYGPKLVENIVQAIARDILCYAMRTLKNCSIVAHVHDEIIIEARRDMSVDAVCGLMSRTPPWAKELLLRADGYECDFYMKD